MECGPYTSIDRFDQAAIRHKINKFYTFLLVLFDFLSFKIFNCKYHFIIDITISKKLQMLPPRLALANGEPCTAILNVTSRRAIQMTTC